MSETTSNMSQIGLFFPNTANEAKAEASLDLQHQEAHADDDGIFTKLLETHCLYLSTCKLSP